jgi:hypothetical protein
LIVGWDDFASLVLIELNGLEEVNKYSSPSSSSLLVVKLISVKRMDSAFLFPLLTACSLFRLQLPLSALLSSKRKAKDFFPGPALTSKQAFFCCLNLEIALQSAVLWLLLSQ